MLHRWRNFRALHRQRKPDPSENYHKGIAWFNVTVQGKSFHAAYPNKGTNAIYKTMDFVTRLRNTSFSKANHPILGDYTITLGRICGGNKINMVPSSCITEWDFRLIPGMKARKVEKQLEELAAQMREEDPEFNCRIEMVVGRDPVAISKRLFFLKDLERIVKEVKGSRPKIIGTIADSDGYHFRKIAGKYTKGETGTKFGPAF